MGRFCRGRAGWLPWVMLLSALLTPAGAPWADTVKENAAKAALAFNFARYTDWPQAAVAASPSQLRVCVLGDDALVEAFQGIGGKRVGERLVRVSDLSARDNPGSCDLIHIQSRDRRAISFLLSRVRDLPVLTVGEIPDFADYSGIINLYRSDGKFRFEVSLKAAKRANLVISSRLLRLARIVQ